MKTKLVLIGLLLAAGLFIVSNHTTAQSGPAKGKAEVVVLQTFEESPPYTGILVFNSSSSAGAPKFPSYPGPMVQVGQALADLISQGYEVSEVGQSGYKWIAVKRQ